MKRAIAFILMCVAPALAVAQPSSVVNSKHNLSASGPGPVRSSVENQVCIFCHAPHNSSPVRPLWNRQTPVDAYTIYTSRSMDALPGQPTGTSKMCLSCHDGTIALGDVVSRSTPILMSGGVTTMPAGASNLGLALSDDHPISFRYDSALAGKDRKIRNPVLLPPEVRLDANSELQCTTCHDAHNDSLGKFLVKRNDNSQLCTSCHQVGTTLISAHQNCAACHQPHSAPSGPHLLRKQTVSETCLQCHNGTIATADNIASEMSKVSVHDTHSPADPPDPASDHASCVSCHEPHTMGRGAGAAPEIHANFGSVAGMSASGGVVEAARAEYEVCFRCHADDTRVGLTIARQIAQPNKRLPMSQTAVSFHPVEGPGRNLDVPSLKPGLTVSSIIYCSSCHSSDGGKTAGGSGPDGTHGSNHRPLLSNRYDTADYTAESAQAYALCYRCHDRNNILDDRSFPYHKKHIVEYRTSCATCHDAHGIATVQGNPINNSNLMNFATLIVTPDQSTGKLQFRDLGMFRGECYLTCHGAKHSPRSY